jgi:hypothetical protein
MLGSGNQAYPRPRSTCLSVLQSDRDRARFFPKLGLIRIKECGTLIAAHLGASSGNLTQSI